METAGPPRSGGERGGGGRLPATWRPTSRVLLLQAEAAELLPSSGEEQPEAASQPGRALGRAALAAALVAVAAALSTAAWLSTRKVQKAQYRESIELETTWTTAFDSKCGKMEVDVEYQDETSGWGTNYDHIPTPEMCCAMCQGVSECKAFTWVKDAGLEGCPSQCWLKGGLGKPRKMSGLVSGVPPARRALASVPSGKGGVGGTLFCFSLMVPGTDEVKLLKWQYANKASIFACDGFAVYSNKKIQVAPGLETAVVDSDLKCEYGGDSGTALNAWIFIAVFKKLLDDGFYRTKDWVVKADPDAVFFPDRLGKILAEHMGAGYINNCKYGMHGPIEVFSTKAMNTLAADYKAAWDGKAPSRCVHELHFGQWGEDMFLDQCLSKVLEIKPRPTDERLMCEAHCDCPAWYWCDNGTSRVSYHPFKTVDAYANCMANAMGGNALAPTPSPSSLKTHSVLHSTAALSDDKESRSSPQGSSLSLRSPSSSRLHTSSSSEHSPSPPAVKYRHASSSSVVTYHHASYKQDFESQCPVLDEDVEYQDEGSGFGMQLDHIPTPEMCCALCQGEEKCKAFTWVKDAGLEGCPSQCWLKGATGMSKAKKGVVSGVPPKRMQLYAVPAGSGGAGGSLYCFSLMVPTSTEPKLLVWQHKMKASIFACDEAAVFSNKKIEVAPGVVTSVVESNLKCEYGGDSQSALNSWIFIAVWDKLIDDGHYKKHDWVVKVDPDAVFFPDRLGRILADHGGAAYINNCKYGMHGPIEVFSRAAIDTLAVDYEDSWDGKAPSTCVHKLHFGQWGEDMFIDQCLKTALKVSPSPLDERLMCESHCDCSAWYWCSNGTDRVSYHPFKTVSSYENCMANALAAGSAASAGSGSSKSLGAGASSLQGSHSIDDVQVAKTMQSQLSPTPSGLSPTPVPKAAQASDVAAALKSGVSASKVPPPGPRAMTFYVYRAQSAADYPLENLNAADLPGVLWYLHNEVVTATPRKYKIDRIKRYMITVKNTWEFWNAHHRQFGAFVAYDAAKCTTPVCQDIYHQYGFIVGCQVVDIKLGGYRGVNQTTWSCEKGSEQCYAPLWYSLPGPCPNMGLNNGHIAANKVGLDVMSAKSAECIKRMPGGHCEQASGDPDCTYSYLEAGEIMLDDLVGIEDYHYFWNTSYTRCAQKVASGLLSPDTECVHQKEFIPFLDKGVGCHFWDGKFDKDKCDARMLAVQRLFKKHYPQLPESLEAPPCDFDMYYENEFSWKANHSGAPPSSWWDSRMPVAKPQHGA